MIMFRESANPGIGEGLWATDVCAVTTEGDE